MNEPIKFSFKEIIYFGKKIHEGTYTHHMKNKQKPNTFWAMNKPGNKTFTPKKLLSKLISGF